MIPSDHLETAIAFYQGYYNLTFLQAIIRLREDLAVLIKTHVRNSRWHDHPIHEKLMIKRTDSAPRQGG